MSSDEKSLHLRRQKELDLRQAENEWERFKHKRQDLENRSIDLNRQILRLQTEHDVLSKDFKKAQEEETEAKNQINRIKREISKMIET